MKITPLTIMQCDLVSPCIAMAEGGLATAQIDSNNSTLDSAFCWRYKPTPIQCLLNDGPATPVLASIYPALMLARVHAHNIQRLNAVQMLASVVHNGPAWD